MKHTLLFAILSLFMAVSCADTPKQSFEAEVEVTSEVKVAAAPIRCGWNAEMPKLRGDVDSVLVVERGTESGMIYKYSYTFNSRGDVEEWRSFFADGEPCDRRVYRYDAEGRNTELAWYRHEGPFWQTVRYKYDAEGKMVESCEGTEGSILNREIYNYDEQGRLVKEIFGDGEEENHGRVCYKYDAEGHKIEKLLSYSPSGELYSKTQYLYDADGNEVGVDYYDDDGKMWSSVRYSYDSKGNRTEFVDDSWHHRYLYKYDAQDNVVECKVYDAKTKALCYVVEYTIYYRQK